MVGAPYPIRRALLVWGFRRLVDYGGFGSLGTGVPGQGRISASLYLRIHAWIQRFLGGIVI